LEFIQGLTGLVGVPAVFAFRWCGWQARERGYIDRTANY